MKRTITTAAVCAGLALIGAPAGFATDGENNGKNEIAKACHELKKADKDAFRATYGPKHAMRNCKKGEEPVADETTRPSSRTRQRNVVPRRKPILRPSTRRTGRMATKRTPSASASPPR